MPPLTVPLATFIKASSICGKFANSLPLRLYKVTPIGVTTANTRTPSSLTSRRLMPFILAGRSVESCANWHENTGMRYCVLPNTLFRVLSVMPQRRSLRITGTHTKFHSSLSNSSLMLLIMSLAAWPLVLRVRSASNRPQNRGHGLARPVSPAVSGSCFTWKVWKRL